ncbi:MAG: hypothetical protein K2L98_01755 [Bacilli bacterium]|nr:hypothetical protein [Bacilli bacterium]
MERFAWDMNHINERQMYYEKLLEKTTDERLREKYEDLFFMYSLLITERLCSDGEPKRKKMPVIAKIREVQKIQEIDKYSDEVLKIKNSIIEQMRFLDTDLPYVQFRQSMKGKNLVNLIGEAIHDIFGDSAYMDYKNIAIDSTSKIQIGNRESNACMHCIEDGDSPDYYILLPKLSNIMIVNNLSHEAGHHHRFVVNNAEILANNILREYESFSYELRVLDYFIKNGIYKREALKAMIRFINMLDAFAGLFNELDLVESETAEEMTRKARKRDLYRRLHIPNNEVLLDYLNTIKDGYMFPCIYSAMCVFDHMKTDDSLDRYETVIQNIGIMPEEELIKEIVDNPEDINNLNGYKEYKEDIKRLYKGE